MTAPRHPMGTCMWCEKRKARKWVKTNDSTPSNIAKEARCWLCWRRLPSHAKGGPERAVNKVRIGYMVEKVFGVALLAMTVIVGLDLMRKAEALFPVGIGQPAFHTLIVFLAGVGPVALAAWLVHGPEGSEP